MKKQLRGRLSATLLTLLLLGSFALPQRSLAQAFPTDGALGITVKVKNLYKGEKINFNFESSGSGKVAIEWKKSNNRWHSTVKSFSKGYSNVVLKWEKSDGGDNATTEFRVYSNDWNQVQKMRIGYKPNDKAMITEVILSSNLTGLTHFYTYYGSNKKRAHIDKVILPSHGRLRVFSAVKTTLSSVENLDKCTKLERFTASDGFLKNLDFSKSPLLKFLDLYYNDALETIKFSPYAKLNYINVAATKLNESSIRSCIFSAAVNGDLLLQAWGKSAPMNRNPWRISEYLYHRVFTKGEHVKKTIKAVRGFNSGSGQESYSEGYTIPSFDKFKDHTVSYKTMNYQPEQKFYKVNIATQPRGGKITTNPDYVRFNYKYTLKATPDWGYTIRKVRLHPTTSPYDIKPNKEASFYMANEGVTVIPQWEKLKFTVKLNYNANEGSVSIDNYPGLSPSIPYNTYLRVKVEPKPGYAYDRIEIKYRDPKYGREKILEQFGFWLENNTDVVVYFKKAKYQVILDKKGSGVLEVDGKTGNFSADYDQLCNVTATPNSGHELVSLTADGVDIKSTKQFRVKGATHVRAVFAKKSAQTYPVTIRNHTGGKITISGMPGENLNAVRAGTRLKAIVSLDAGYFLSTLEANGLDIKSDGTFIVNGPTEVEATYTKKIFKVTMEGDDNGTIDVEEDGLDFDRIEYGQVLNIVANPIDGYELATLTANDMDIKDAQSVTITGATTIKATFAEKSYAVTLEKPENGNIKLANEGIDLTNVTHGTMLDIVVTPDKGYMLETLTANGLNIKDTKSVIVTETTTIKATFDVATCIVSLPEIDGGTFEVEDKSVNIAAVPYGSKLKFTIAGKSLSKVASSEKVINIRIIPDEGKELMSLLANGEDISESFEVVVEDDIRIEAEFGTETALDEVATLATKLYPNPTSNFLYVEEAYSNTPYRFVTLDGALLRSGVTDDEGKAVLDLRGVATGSYLFVIKTNTFKVIVR